jgi:diadenosine tetraphosphate (Ap4A) HIT family hydrolase
MYCELCDKPGGELIWQDALCRAVLIDEPDYPGFCRIILQRHVKETSELAPQERTRLMQVVFAMEAALTELMAPDKINLASLGNVVPHVHWHVIPRFRDDKHFPNPVWGPPLREGVHRTAPKIAALRDALERELQTP